MKRRIFWSLFLLFFETADLRSYCGYFWHSASYVYAIFRLTDFSSDAFDFSSLKTG